MGLRLGPVLKPSASRPALKNLVLSQSRSMICGSCSRTSIAAMQAAATAGGCDVEKRNGRARGGTGSRRALGCRRRNLRARRSPSTACRPGCRRARARRNGRSVPRPFVPNTPLACASSTIMMQPNSSASAQSSGSAPRSPSMLNTPSVMSSFRWVGRQLAEQTACGVHVLVRKHLDGGAAQSAPVDDAGVIELVRHDDVVLAQDRGDRARVRREAALKDDDRLDLLEVGEPALELDVDRHRAGDAPDRPRPDAERPDSFERPLPQERVRGEAEIVVRRKVDDVLMVEARRGLLFAVENSQTTVEALPLKPSSSAARNARGSGRDTTIPAERAPSRAGWRAPCKSRSAAR